jgi:hypothetical protein
MTDRVKTKNLRRALAFLLAVGPLVGLSAAPAMATTDPNSPSFNIDVMVSDSTCVPSYSPATWMPTLTTYDPNVDLAAPTPVLFDVYLGFSAGIDANVCGVGDELPTGTVHAEFTTLPSSLEKNYLDCELGVVTCEAANLYDIVGGVISGSLSVTNDATEGLQTATVKVVWTPAG